MRRVHGRIAALVGELRTVYPHDPRVAHYLPEPGPRSPCSARGAWFTPKFARSSRRPRIPSCGTARSTSKRPSDSGNRSTVRTAVSLAESFAAQAPGDKRAGELLHMAAFRLRVDWSTLVRLAAVFAMVAGLLAATIGIGRWLKYVLRVGVVLLAVFAVALAGFFFLANDTLIATIRYLYEKISDGSPMVLSGLLSVTGLEHGSSSSSGCSRARSERPSP